MTLAVTKFGGLASKMLWHCSIIGNLVNQFSAIHVPTFHSVWMLHRLLISSTWVLYPDPTLQRCKSDCCHQDQETTQKCTRLFSLLESGVSGKRQHIVQLASMWCLWSFLNTARYIIYSLTGAFFYLVWDLPQRFVKGLCWPLVLLLIEKLL